MVLSSAFDETFIFPGPTFHVDLAGLDARHPIHYSRRLLLFRCTTPEQRDAQLAALKIGLQALVSRCPILGGIVVPVSPDIASDEWRTIVPDRGLELIVKDLRISMPSFESIEASGFSADNFPYGPLVPVPEDLNNDRNFAACKIQFSAIDGGTIITWAMSHSVADGSGNNELIRILSEETRFAHTPSLEGKPRPTGLGLDRTIMRNMKLDKEFKIEEHPAYKWATPAPNSTNPKSPHPFEASSPEVPVVFHISPTRLAQLKSDATSTGSPQVSTHDALSALMWRSLLLIRRQRSDAARDLPDSTLSNVFMPSDARRRLNLPNSYIGNAVYQLTASLDIGNLLSPSGLQRAASVIRKAITAATPELVSSCIATTNERWIDWQFADSYSTTGMAMGTDWGSGVLYDQDWGEAFGPLIRFRYPGDAFCCIYPKLRDGAAEVMMGVLPGEVEILRSVECFGKYLEG